MTIGGSIGDMSIMIFLVRTLLIGAYISAIITSESPGESSWPGGVSGDPAKIAGRIAHDSGFESENGTTSDVRRSDVLSANWTADQGERRKRESFGVRRNGIDELFNHNPTGYDGRIGLFLFTRYCGPGSRIWKRLFAGERSYADIDRCCQIHDDCPNFVEKREHYDQYPGLEFRPQFFSRVQCTCDTDFYKCLTDLSSPYAYSVAIGYSIFQRNCLELEHPIEGCLQYYSSFGMQRCEVYQVNRNLPKVWQWFDVLPPYSNITHFPQIAQSNSL